MRTMSKLDLKEGEEVDIELKGKNLFGLLKGWKIDSQSLKDELREING
jgi:predicted DNA-binding antitoxin AbrB/MazE fold protein